MKSNSTPKRVTSDRGLAPRQYSSEETSHWCQAVDDSVSDMIGPGNEPHTSRPDSVALTTDLTVCEIYFKIIFVLHLYFVLWLAQVQFISICNFL